MKESAFLYSPHPGLWSGKQFCPISPLLRMKTMPATTHGELKEFVTGWTQDRRSKMSFFSLKIFIFKLDLFSCFVHMWGCVMPEYIHVIGRVWNSKENLGKHVLFCHLGLGDSNQIIRLGGKCLYEQAPYPLKYLSIQLLLNFFSSPKLSTVSP